MPCMLECVHPCATECIWHSFHHGLKLASPDLWDKAPSPARMSGEPLFYFSMERADLTNWRMNDVCGWCINAGHQNCYGDTESNPQSVMVTAKCSWEIAMCGHAAYFDMQNATTKLELDKITISQVLFVCLFLCWIFFSGNNVSGTMQ